MTIVSVVASAIGLFLALRADIGKRIDRVEDRLGKRIDRVEDRARADRLEFVAEISQMKTSVSAQIAELNATVSAQTTELKTAVGVLGAKLDERSAPQRLVVQEPRADYQGAGRRPGRMTTAVAESAIRTTSRVPGHVRAGACHARYSMVSDGHSRGKP